MTPAMDKTVEVSQAARELLPCPFCGATAQAIEGGGLWFARCASRDCWAAYGEQYDRDAMHDHVFSERGAAIAAWNTRATQPEAALREALEPFALISSEGVIKQQSGHVTVVTCAEYFHRAAAALKDHRHG